MSKMMRPGFSRILQFRAVGAIAVAAGLSPGCGLFCSPFVAGEYGADLPCTLDVVDPTGATASEPFTSANTVKIDASGRFLVNDVELAVGREVLRSTPTVELAFEVTKLTRRCNQLTVTYEPRPSLPGITVEGQLVETYRGNAGSILVSARADLTVLDASGTSEFGVQCDGVLEAKEP